LFPLRRSDRRTTDACRAFSIRASLIQAHRERRNTRFAAVRFQILVAAPNANVTGGPEPRRCRRKGVFVEGFFSP
jgi:hypothetical protein